MPWAKCVECNRSLDMPTLGDALVGIQVCGFCHVERKVPDFEKRMVADELVEKIGELE